MNEEKESVNFLHLCQIELPLYQNAFKCTMLQKFIMRSLHIKEIADAFFIYFNLFSFNSIADLKYFVILLQLFNKLSLLAQSKNVFRSLWNSVTAVHLQCSL